MLVVQACFLPVSLYLHLKICENPWFRGILTDWCCHADAVTVLMLDGLMIYVELWDAPNESRVNVHLSRQISGCGGLLTSSPDPTVEGTDWVAGLQLNPAHSREEDHARRLRRRRGGERRLMRPDQAQQWVTTEAMRAEQQKNPSSSKKLKEKSNNNMLFSLCKVCKLHAWQRTLWPTQHALTCTSRRYLMSTTQKFEYFMFYSPS